LFDFIRFLLFLNGKFVCVCVSNFYHPFQYSDLFICEKRVSAGCNRWVRRSGRVFGKIYINTAEIEIICLFIWWHGKGGYTLGWTATAISWEVRVKKIERPRRCFWRITLSQDSTMSECACVCGGRGWRRDEINATVVAKKLFVVHVLLSALTKKKY